MPIATETWILHMYGGDAGQPPRSLYTKGLLPLCDGVSSLPRLGFLDRPTFGIMMRDVHQWRQQTCDEHTCIVWCVLAMVTVYLLQEECTWRMQPPSFPMSIRFTLMVHTQLQPETRCHPSVRQIGVYKLVCSSSQV